SLLLRHFIRPLGQAVKTPPFHGGNTGSNPVGVITARGTIPTLEWFLFTLSFIPVYIEVSLVIGAVSKVIVFSFIIQLFFVFSFVVRLVYFNIVRFHIVFCKHFIFFSKTILDLVTVKLIITVVITFKIRRGL